MAKILYGVAGEGSGHSTRVKVIIEYLQSKNHTVKVISYGKGYKALRPYFDIEKIFGLHFAFKNNEIKPLLTIFNNLSKTSEAAKSVKKINTIIDKFRPDFIFSDFEPISAYLAKIKKIPLISIDNQHRLNNTEIEYPNNYKKDAFIAKAITRLMMFGAKAYLIIDFSSPNITHKKTFVFPPILRNEILSIKPKDKNYILVYLSSAFKEIIPILKSIKTKFIIYGFEKDKEEKNLIFKKNSYDGFLKDLADCKAIIANAGFSLIGEALYLKKPYLAIPIKGQFEQIFNAYYLEKTGYGKYYDELNKEKIELFLNNLDYYKNNLKKYKAGDNKKIFKKIDELISEAALK